MRLRRLVPLLAVVVALGCQRDPVAPDQPPDWLLSLIAEFERQPPDYRPPVVASYVYDGAVVYYVAPRCCDVYSDLYTMAGSIVCHPDGGITGGGDGRCPSFFATRRDERVVWTDPASRSRN